MSDVFRLSSLRAGCKLLILTLIFTACGGGEKPLPVPRPAAYPRVQECDTLMRQAVDLPVKMDVNATATTVVTPKDDGTLWLDVSYPMYGATVSYTFLPVTRTNLMEAIANRQERIRRDIGSARPQLSAFDSEGNYAVQLLYTPSVLATPVHFLAVLPDEPRWMVSGAAYFSNLPANAAADSLAPMSAAICADVVRSLHSLSDL